MSNQMRKYKSTKSTKVQKYKSTKKLTSCLDTVLRSSIIVHGSSYALSNLMRKYKSSKSTKVQKYKSTKRPKNEEKMLKHKNPKKYEKMNFKFGHYSSL